MAWGGFEDFGTTTESGFPTGDLRPPYVERRKVLSDLIAQIDANIFRAAHLLCSKDDCRYCLQGVRIEKHPEGGVLLVATDGHRMIVIHDESGRARRPIVVQLDRDGLNGCAPNKRTPSPRLTIDRDGLAATAFWRGSKSALIDGTYPEWRKIIPVQKWLNVPASFNARYVGDFGKISQMLGGDNESRRAIRIISGEDQSSPALVLFPAYPFAFGVLMPMRAPIESGLPEWMKPVLEPTKPKKKTAPAKVMRKKAA